MCRLLFERAEKQPAHGSGLDRVSGVVLDGGCGLQEGFQERLHGNAFAGSQRAAFQRQNQIGVGLADAQNAVRILRAARCSLP